MMNLLVLFAAAVLLLCIVVGVAFVGITMLTARDTSRLGLALLASICVLVLFSTVIAVPTMWIHKYRSAEAYREASLAEERQRTAAVVLNAAQASAHDGVAATSLSDGSGRAAEHTEVAMAGIVQEIALPPEVIAEVSATDMAAVDSESLEERAAATAQAPEWFADMPVREGAIHSEVISSGPYTTPQECYAVFEEHLEIASNRYVLWYINHELGLSLTEHDIQQLRIAPPRIVDKHHLYLQGREYQVGYMYTLYGQLQFDEAFRDRVANRVRESASMNRLALAGMTSGGLLMGVASLCGLFRVRVARKNLR
jgi:hypothetical protein